MAKAKNNKGAIYERQVKGVVKEACRSIPNVAVSSRAAAANNPNLPDIELIIGKKHRIGIEIKLDGRAQMGNPGNIAYDRRSESFGFVDNIKKKNSKEDDEIEDESDGEGVDGATIDLIMQAVQTKRRPLNGLIDFIKTYPPTDYNSNCDGSPVKCSYDAWTEAVAKGLLRPLNGVLKYDVSVIINYYKDKGINYMQIGGGAGFFYLADNPLGINVPKLTGNVDIELRLKSRGAKPRKGLGFDVVTSPFVAIPRLRTNVTSPYTLDNRDHVLMLFGGF